MKKALSLLLALAMCLSLAACGVDEKYNALLENLASNNYDGIKQELSALSPDFAAEQEKLEEYADLIAALEAENWEAAVADIVSRVPVTEPEEPTYTEVKITMDNWQEYFEIREYETHRYNDFGEEESSSSGYGIYLKEEYLDDLKEQTADVSFKVVLSIEFREYDKNTQQFVADGELLSAEKMEHWGFDANEEDVWKVEDWRWLSNSKTDVSTAYGQVCASFVFYAATFSEYKTYKSICTEFAVIDVTGTLTLADKT